MEKNKPLDLNLEQLKDKTLARHNEYRFIHPDFGIAISFAGLESYLVNSEQPYRTKEGRIMRVLKGSARVSINLIEYDICQGMVVVAPPNSIVQIIQFTPEYDFQAIVPGSNILSATAKEDLTEYFYLKRSIVLHLTDAEWKEMGMYFSLIWKTVQESTFRREIIQHLLAALLYNIRYIQKRYQKTVTEQPSHQEEIFRRFIALVNEHSKSERTVGFYADKLCLTPRYLNTVIRQTSRQTVMEWINQAVILEAQVLLKHSDLLVYQIADELHFPNPSFFCKFFKKRTGMTPQEYQKK
ncbi:helix-turn-helix domain-containing protein [Bacteroides sp.]